MDKKILFTMRFFNKDKVDYHKKMIINFNFLKDQYLNGNLKGADIFAELFKLKDSKFLSEPMQLNELNELLICVTYNISFSEWNVFLNFLKSGKKPFLVNNDNINILIEISNKFGCIPSIDNYYKNYIEFEKKKKKIYNPMCPKDDYKQLYNWIVDYKHNKDYSVTEKTGCEYFFRQLKK